MDRDFYTSNQSGSSQRRTWPLCGLQHRGRNGFFEAGGIAVNLFAPGGFHPDETQDSPPRVELRGITSKHATSDSARLTVPVADLEWLIQTLQDMQALAQDGRATALRASGIVVGSGLDAKRERNETL